MWSAGNRAVIRPDGCLDVYVGSRGLLVCGNGNAEVVLSVTGVEEGLNAVKEWLAKAPTKHRIRAWLSGGLCRPFRLPPVPGVKNEAELSRIAESTAGRHSGLTGECRMWMDRGSLTESRVCAAVQASTIDLVLDALRPSARHRVLSIRPWWSDVLRAALARTTNVVSVAAHDCDSLTILTGHDGAFEFVSTSTPLADRDAADAVLARFLISGDVDPRRHVLARLVITEGEKAKGSSDIALGRFVDISP